jgi:hypothetical protein
MGGVMRTWSHGSYQIEEGLKPGSSHFQYFYLVLDKGHKKANYCVWIEDEALSRFPSGDFESVAESQRALWNKWVKNKIDKGDFSNKVLRISREGEQEIELSEMKAHLSMD